MGRPVRRVLSGGRSPVDGHLSRRHVAVPLLRPTRGLGEPRQHPLSGLAPGEVYLAGRLTTTPVVSYTAVSPLPGSPPAVCSLWHCLADHSGWVLPTALPCGARTFLGAAANRERRDRPADPFAWPSLAPPPERACGVSPSARSRRSAARAGSRSGSLRTGVGQRMPRPRVPRWRPHPRARPACGS
jgi:hypothetical protein